MDPVSHVAFSYTLIGVLRSDRRRDGPLRGCVAAAVLGSLCPDLDAALMPFGWDRYLRVHEVGTHTIAGALTCALVTAGVVRAFARQTRYAWLALSAGLGTASHLLLDLLSSARLRPAWPFVDTAVSVPLVAMADPWLFSICVCGPVALWGAGRSRGRHAGVAVLAVMAVFLVSKASLGILAFSNYRRASDRSSEIVLAQAIEAKWASLNTWYVFDRTANRVRTWSASADSGAHEVWSWPIGPDTTHVSGSRSLSTVRNFRRAHDLEFAVTLPQGDGRVLVLWSDIRFCWDPTVPEALALEPIVQSPTGDRRIACGLWFGGELDADGRARLEVVKVGGFTQTRAPAR
jgi:membrane-bound metal-dependent hydrolase YbcI (DUF457 family)